MSLSDWRSSRTVRAIFWAAACLALVMAVLPHPPELPGHPSDKVQHVIAFTALALIGSFAYPAMRASTLLFLLSLFGAFIEVLQGIPIIHRDSDVLDWIADTAAAALVLAIVWWWRSRRKAG